MAYTPGDQSQWRFTSLILLFTNELCLIASTTTNHIIFGKLSLLTYECILILRQAWIAFNVILSHLPYFVDDQQTSAVVTQLGPLLSSMAMRSDISTMTLDRIIKSELGTAPDQEECLDRVVEAMAMC